MTSSLALFAWLVAAHGYIEVGPHEHFDDARETIQKREFWVLRDPAQPSVSRQEARERGAISYRVLIEVGLEGDLAEWVHSVNTVLADSRGWKAAGRELLAVSDRARLTVLLARPATVDRLCKPLRTNGEYSCGRRARASLNLTRWREGTKSWGEDVLGYRVYMINHEVGHLLGMPHRPCKGEGKVAPVMLQQTFGLDGCEAAGWPNKKEINWLRGD